MTKEYFNPPTLATPRSYTHVVTARAGKTIYVAGQVALDEQGQVVGRDDFAAQARQTFANLQRALAAAGATFADVVKLTTFIVNYRPELRQALLEARSEYLPMEHLPASTLVGVQALASPDFLIEIEAIAVVD